MFEYLARFIAGGLLVCLFALISQVFQPKQFAGLFSAAPSVLLAGLALTLILKGTGSAIETAEGAIAGAMGMIAYCLVASHLLSHQKALTASLLALVAWAGVTAGVFGILHLAFQW